MLHRWTGVSMFQFKEQVPGYSVLICALVNLNISPFPYFIAVFTILQITTVLEKFLYIPYFKDLSEAEIWFNIHILNLFSFIFWLCSAAWGILVPWPGIKPIAPAVEAWSLNHWTTREVPKGTSLESGLNILKTRCTLIQIKLLVTTKGAWWTVAR